MMTGDRATCIVFSDDDLSPKGSDHTHPLYITVVGQWLNLERMPIGYRYRPWLCTFRLWSLYTDGHGYFDDRVVDWSDYIPYTILDMFASSEPVLQISHNLVTMSFDQHSSMVVLDMMRGIGVDELQHQFHHLYFSDDCSFITRSSRFLSLCFPDETTNYGVNIEPIGVTDGVVPHDEYRDEMDMSMSQIAEMVQPESASSFDLFGVSLSRLLRRSAVLARAYKGCYSW
ncbi:hypothetical protein AAG906_018463 [Vitis piasezkii]